MKTLKTRPFGRTGERVTAIGLGGARLDAYSLDEGVATVRRALELGVTYFDTSPLYAEGASQVVLGRALEGHSEPYMLATKLGHFRMAAHYRSPDAIRAQLGENLRALRRDQIDVLQVHEADQAWWWEDGVTTSRLVNVGESYDFSNAPVLQVLREARESGLCRYTGITGNNSEEMAWVLRHVEVDACLVAYQYGIVQRIGRRTVVPLARDRGIAFVSAGAVKRALDWVHSVWLSTPPPELAPELRDRPARLLKLLRQSGLTLSALAIRFLLADPAISTIVVGTGTPDHVEQFVAAAEEGPLPADLHQAVEELGAA